MGKTEKGKTRLCNDLNLGMRGPEEGGSNAYFRDRYNAITVECVKTQKQKDFAGECCA